MEKSLILQLVNTLKGGTERLRILAALIKSDAIKTRAAPNDWRYDKD